MSYVLPEESEVIGALVIPLYNEAQRWDHDYFVKLHSQLAFKKWRLIFVNDGSTDETGYIVNAFSANRDCLVMELDKNLGKSDAVRKGLLFAATRFPNVAFLGMLDADGAFEVNDVERLADLSSKWKSDVVIGSRVKLSGLNIQRKTSRHLIGRIISTVVNVLFFKINIYDPQSGLKIYTNSSRLIRSLDHPFHTRWFGDVELFLRLESHEELEVREYPISSWRDIEGSKLQISSAISVFIELFKLLLLRICAQRS